MVRKTKEEAEATRQKLLDKAEEVFERRGVSRTSLQDIAAAAGLTRGAIYWHFKDKADVFQAMMDRVCLPCEAAVDGAMAPRQAGDWAVYLEGLGSAVLQRLSEDPQMRRVFAIAMHRTELGEELGAVFERRLQIIEQFVSELRAEFQSAAAAGLLRPGVEPDDAAVAYFALLDGLMHNWTLKPERFDLVRVGRTSLSGYLRGLAAD